MENMKLPNRDSATGRAIVTGIQAIVGFFAGLVFTVWAVPGVPQAVINYVGNNLLQLALLVGIPAAIFTFAWNYFRKNVINY